MADERYSQNRATYFTLDFGNITEKGLKKLIDAFRKAGQTVANVEATNRVIKKDRLATKKFAFRFENGQSITVTVGDQGDIIETKLNATIIPVKSMDTMTGYAKEVGQKMQANQVRFDKSLARKTKQVVDTSATKPAGRTIQARLIEAEIANSAASSNAELAKAKLAELESKAAQNQSNLADLKAKLAVERATTNDLIQQIEAAGGKA
ncbi:hypothetical protein [Aeromonas hydrophila]|uniref:defense against restriction DarA-related protein n=1 Tax=Aeromonas hydrophila TaxID=644 RepID=UPI003D24D7F7